VKRGRNATGLQKEDGRAAEGEIFKESGFFVWWFRIFVVEGGDK